MMADDRGRAAAQTVFRRGAQLYPQPVAMTLGRVLRSGTAHGRLDACLRAAEVLTRYLAAAALASFGAREAELDDGLSIPPLRDNLSFGQFLAIVQQIAKLPVAHPLAPYLTPFRAKSKERGPGTADAAITALLTLRNDLGHDLGGLSDTRAQVILAQEAPETRLAEAVEALHGLLSLPLFVVEDQRIGKGQIVGRRLWLMGESRDPEPEEVPHDSVLDDVERPCLAVGERVLTLWPVLSWAILAARSSYGLLFADKVLEGRIQYQSLDPVDLDENGAATATLAALCAGDFRPAARLRVRSGRTVEDEWSDERNRREAAVELVAGAMPWHDLDTDTLAWFAKGISGTEHEDARRVVAERLLDARDRFTPSEIRQALLLFGTDEAVLRTLQREMMDHRVQGPGDERWLDRQLGHANVVKSLRESVAFFARHVGVADASLDGLSRTSGTADYLAMREALVNLFIHQDYEDASAAAQVVLRPSQALFFNAGYSLVAGDRLVEGGKSQSRNPLIARALRMLGFAELAGSGIRTLQAAWRQARRRPPRFESDREANSFTVTLDWREVPSVYDAYWKARIGVSVTAEQARILELAFDPAGITAAQAAAGTGLTVDEARDAMGYLVRQVLLQTRDDRFFVADHLREIVG